MQNKTKKLIYLISHGHTARGALQTNLLYKLKKANIEVIVVAKIENEALKNLVEAQGSSIDYYVPKSGQWDGQRTIFRAFVHQNIRKNPALWEKHQRRVNGKKSSLKRQLLNHFYFLLGTTIRHVTPLKQAYYQLEKKIFYNPKAVSLLEMYKPDAVISTRPVDSMEAEILNAATRLGIHKIMYILSWDNITSKGIFSELADSYLTWGEVMNQELREYYGAKDQQLYISGVTHFDVHAQIKKQTQRKNTYVDQLGLDSAKPYLFFTMSASYFAPNEIDVIEWLAEKIERNSFGSEMQLIIRPHMQNLESTFSESSWIQRLTNLNSERVVVNWPNLNSDQLTWFMDSDEMVKLSSLLKGAAICLNSGSTVAIEACILDRPVILPMIDVVEKSDWESVKRVLKFKHIEKFVSFGAVEVAFDFDELNKAILRTLKNPDLLFLNRTKVVESECFKVDGKATDRFVENILLILNSSEKRTPMPAQRDKV